MTSLGTEGVISLRAMQQWISVIDTNLVNAHRAGYKQTRVSLGQATERNIGKTLDRLGYSIQVPTSQLKVDKTQILDYEQGTIEKTDSSTDFALHGRGYFVVEDTLTGERFATRDGEFHFDNNGYLSTGQGLRVLSAGQDYIRVPSSDKFYVDKLGRSSGMSTYGDRQIMVMQLPVASHLYFSKYGFTTFELGPYLPLTFDNDFDHTMDGLNAYAVDPSYEAYWTHYKNELANPVTGARGVVEVDLSVDSQAMVTSHTFTDFRNHFDFIPRSIGVGTGFASFGLSFGQQDASYTITEGGYGAGIYQDAGGNWNLALVQGGSNPNIITQTAIPAPVNGTEYRLEIVKDMDRVSVVFSETASAIAIGQLNSNISTSLTSGAYQSLGTLTGATALPALAATAAGDTLEVSGIHTKEINRQQYYQQIMIGGKAEDLDTLIEQYHIEQSTTVMSDVLTELGTAQKVFSAISKVINVHNTLSDDLHALIR